MAMSEISMVKDVFTTLQLKLINNIEVRRAVLEAHKLKLISDWQRETCLKRETSYDMGTEFVGILIRKINASEANFYTLLDVLGNM